MKQVFANRISSAVGHGEQKGQKAMRRCAEQVLFEKILKQ